MKETPFYLLSEVVQLFCHYSARKVAQDLIFSVHMFVWHGTQIFKKKNPLGLLWFASKTTSRSTSKWQGVIRVMISGVLQRDM